MYQYTKFDDPTMDSSRDMKSDVNWNVDAHAHVHADVDTGGTPIVLPTSLRRTKKT